ncbi:MAG TPA: hypothetical protein PLD10_23770 [Rhodopila sp.]|nr:hypothetical protein [Rhodopila sp.]
MSGGNKAIFPVIAAAILNSDRPAREYQPGVGEIQPTLLQCDGALGRIEGDVNVFDVSRKIIKSIRTARRSPIQGMRP